MSSPKFLYKYYPCKKEYIENILEEKLYFSFANKFDDIDDSDLAIYNEFGEQLPNIRDEIRVTCFSSVYSDELWHRFANCGNGFCLKFAFDDLLILDKYILEVRYIDINEIKKHKEKILLNFDFDKKAIVNELLAAIIYKDKTKYSVEHEFRIVAKKNKEFLYMLNL